MAHGFLTPQDVSGESPLFGKIAKWLEDQWNKERETTKKNKEEVSGKLDTLQKTVDAVVRDVTKKQAPAYNMLRGSQPKALPSGTKALPPGGPRLPGSSRGPKGGAITNLSGAGGSGISADTFFKRAQSGVGASGEYLTNAQRKQAFIRSRQEAVKTSAATNSPAISPDSGADIVAAVAKNTEAISTLVKVTKEQTSNDTKLSERSALIQEKLMGRQRAAAEERNLEQGKDMSGFLTPTMKKLEKQAKGGGMGGYDANMNRRSTASDLLDIGSDIMDMRKGRVRRITQGRDGRTSRQRLRDMRARRSGGIKPRGRLGALSRLGGAAAKGGALGGLGGGLKGAARGLGKSGPLALLTAGLEFGDRMSSGQNAFQAGVGTAGSVGGGLAGAAAGAAIGSIVPGVGTVIGGLIGGMLGSMAGGGTADMLTGANNIPSGAGGMLSSGPMGGYLSMLHGTELTLSGNNKKETKNIGEALGEGMIMASLGPLNSKVLELSAKGMKHYYENMGGKSMFEGIFEGLGDIFKTGMQGMANLVHGLGGVLANLTLGGAAHAGTMPGGPLTGSADLDGLKEEIRKLESGNDYSSMYSRDRADFARGNEDITKMTIDQVHDLQTDYLRHQAAKGYGEKQRSAAMGAYQMMEVKKVAEMLGIDTSTTLFDKATQDRMSEYYLNIAGYQDWKAGKITDAQFNDQLAVQFASVKKSSGGGAYDNDGMNMAYGNLMPLLQRMRENPTPAAAGGQTVVLAGGTNTYTNPNQAASEMKASILELQKKGYNVVVVPPSTKGEYAAVGNAVTNAAVEAGAKVEVGMYDVNDPTRAYTHLLPEEAKRIREKYSGATFMGDSNAVRISGGSDSLGMRVTGASTSSILSMTRGLSSATPSRAPAPTLATTPLPEAADPEQTAGGNNPEIIPVSHPDTGSGYTVKGLTDSQGRPAVFSRGGAAAFARMMKDSKGVVKGSDIASSKRSIAKNNSLPGAAKNSNHLKGNALDIHGASQTWMRAHGAKYGWIIHDYPGTHGGHFNFRGGGSADMPADSQIASAPSVSAGGGTRANPLGAAPPDLFGTGAAPVPASPAAANTGTGVMQASAQTSGPVFQQPVTVVNNYNVAGQGGGGDVIPNTLGAGVSMGQMGLDSFSQLKIRALG